MKRICFWFGTVICFFICCTSIANVGGQSSQTAIIANVGEQSLQTSATANVGEQSLQTVNPVFTLVVNSGFGSGNINCVVYGNGMFIAGGDNGKISYSSDGITWESITDNTIGSMKINSITYGNDKFVAVTDDGKIVYSPDGISWTLVAESPFVSIDGPPGARIESYGKAKSVIYGNGKFITGGGNGMVMLAWSADGIKWESISGLPSSFRFGFISAIAYDGKEKYLAISYNGMGVETIAASSSDAIKWTPLVRGVFSEKAGITYGLGRFVYAIGGGTIVYGKDGAERHELANGFTWDNNPPNTIFGKSKITCVAYGKEFFIAGGDDGKMAYSINGESWDVLAESVFGTTQINGIAFGNGTFVVVGNEGKIIYSNE